MSGRVAVVCLGEWRSDLSGRVAVVCLGVVQWFVWGSGSGLSGREIGVLLTPKWLLLLLLLLVVLLLCIAGVACRRRALA